MRARTCASCGRPVSGRGMLWLSVRTPPQRSHPMRRNYDKKARKGPAVASALPAVGALSRANHRRSAHRHQVTFVALAQLQIVRKDADNGRGWLMVFPASASQTATVTRLAVTRRDRVAARGGS